MSDINSPFCPILSNFYNLLTEFDKIDQILDKILTIHKIDKNQIKNEQNCGGSAIYSALKLLQNKFGRILWFSSSIPAHGIGKLAPRNNREFYGTEKERILYNCDNAFYKDLAEKCIKECISVDLFIYGHEEYDLANLAVLPNKTGGEIYFYYDLKYNMK